MPAKDYERKMSEAAGAGGAGGGGGGEERFNLDNILSELGSFGKYQLLLLLLLAFRDSFLAMCNFHYVFTAANVNHRCFVPECESLPSPEFNASWTQFALPNASSCHRFDPLATGTATCSPARFDPSRDAPCDEIVYQDYNSIVAEFDLGCSPWKGTLVGTVHNLGLIFSNIVSGLIADRYGRKVIIVGTPLMVGALGLLKSFAVSYWMLLLLEFLETALGYGNASLVLSLESVHHSSRVAYGCFSDSLASLGAASLGLIAWRVPYWRHLVRAIYAPLLVVVFYIFLVDEGVRWLLAHDKRDEAVRVLHKVAKVNNVTLSRKSQDMLRRIAEKNKIDQASEEAGASHLWRALRSRAVAGRVALIACCFFCSSFVFNGSIVNAVAVSGDPHVNVSAMLLVSIPTRLLLAVTLTRFGRKGPICVAYLLCAIFFVTSAFVPKSTGWASTLLYVAGKMASSYGNFAVFVVAAEAFPTTSRNSLVNIGSTVGRLGSVLAPLAPLLAKYMDGLPSVTFGLAALCACGLALLLPDTSGSALPEDVRDVERPDPDPERCSHAARNTAGGVDKTEPSGVSVFKPRADDPPKYPAEPEDPGRSDGEQPPPCYPDVHKTTLSRTSERGKSDSSDTTDSCPAVDEGPRKCDAVPCHTVDDGPCKCDAIPCHTVDEEPRKCDAVPCHTVDDGPRKCDATPCPAVDDGPRKCDAVPCHTVDDGPLKSAEVPCAAVDDGPPKGDVISCHTVDDALLKSNDVRCLAVDNGPLKCDAIPTVELNYHKL